MYFGTFPEELDRATVWGLWGWMYRHEGLLGWPCQCFNHDWYLFAHWLKEEGLL